VGVGACKSKRVAAAAELLLHSFWEGRTVRRRMAIERFEEEALIEK